MAIFNAKNDKTGGCGADTSVWNAVHDSTGGKSHTFTDTNNGTAVRSRTFNAGSATGIFRTFMEFDTTTLTTLPTSATLNIKGYGTSTTNTDIIVIEGTQTTYDGNTFDDFTGFQAGWNNTHVTAYSAEHTTWNDSAYNAIQLNAAALTEMTDEDVIRVCIMTYDYDYLDSQPADGTDISIGMVFKGAGELPYIETIGGYGNNIMGVSSGNISKVNGIAIGNISKVNGI